MEVRVGAKDGCSGGGNPVPRWLLAQRGHGCPPLVSHLLPEGLPWSFKRLPVTLDQSPDSDFAASARSQETTVLRTEPGVRWLDVRQRPRQPPPQGLGIETSTLSPPLDGQPRMPAFVSGHGSSDSRAATVGSNLAGPVPLTVSVGHTLSPPGNPRVACC